MKIKEFKTKVDARQEAGKSKTFRVDIALQVDGSIECTQVRKLDDTSPATEHQATWVPMDKRRFVRGFLNNVEKFTTK